MKVIPLALFLTLAACGGGDGGAAPGGVTPDEARALNEAAEMLDDNAMAADAIATENMR